MAAGGSRFRGMVANLPTALTSDGRHVDAARMRDNVEWLIDTGADGLSCLLSAGAFTYLTADERTEVAGSVVEAARGRVPVAVGVSGESTAATIVLGRAAAGVGVDALMVQPRSYMPLRPPEVLAHFEAVADAVDVPIGIYNNPLATGVDITPAQHVEIVRSTGAVVAKDAYVGLVNVQEVRRHLDQDYGYLWADSSQAVPALQLGAAGWCTSLASVFPREVRDVVDAVAVGEIETAHRALDRLAEVRRRLHALGDVRGIKAAAQLRGHSFGGHRAPLAVPPPEDVAELRDAMIAAGIEGV